MAAALFVGACVVGALAILGSSDAAFSDEVIAVASSVVAAYLVAPVVEFSWHYVRVPQYEMRYAIATLQDEVEELGQLIRPDAAALLDALRAVRDETRDNRRLIGQAMDSGRFWKLSEGAPTTKAWRRGREVISSDPRLQTVWDAGRAATQEVDRILQTRSVRTLFRFDRRVTTEDRLPDVVDRLNELDELITGAIDSLTSQPPTNAVLPDGR